MTTNTPDQTVTRAMRSAIRTGVNPYDSHANFAARWTELAAKRSK